MNITSDFDLYAKWVRLYTVTFMDNGQIVAERTVREGSALTDIPAVPEIEGKNGFWREDGNEPVFSNIRRDMTLHRRLHRQDIYRILQKRQLRKLLLP